MTTEPTTTRPWSGICPDCNERRILWPIGQDVNTGWEPGAAFIHRNGKAECAT